jgi:peptidoglycan/LPS O-acetylase OafA/YrhL
MDIISKLSNKQRNFLIFLIIIPILFLSFLTLEKNSIDFFDCGTNIYDEITFNEYEGVELYLYELNLIKNIGNTKCINKANIEISEQNEPIIYLNVIPTIILNFYFFLSFLLLFFLLKNKFIKIAGSVILYFIFQYIIFFYDFNNFFLNILLILVAFSMLSSLKINPSKDYIPGIDILRAVSIVAVILNHLDQDFLPLGYLGVDIFFVISGFIITKTYFSKNFDSKKSFAILFFGNRIRRLWPALFTMVILTLLLYFNFDLFFKTTLETSGFALLGLSNLFFMFNSFDYFAESSKYNPFLHTWSLGVEEQFYFIYPIIFFLLLKKSKNNHLIFLTIPVSLFLFFYLFNSLNGFVYYSIFTRFWQMLSGVFAAYLVSRKKIVIPYINLFTLLLLVLLFFQKAISPISHFIAVFLTFLLIINSFNVKVNKFTSPLLQIGLISYSLYLWHHPIFTLRYWLPDLIFGNTTLLLFVILISLLSYKYVETPFRNKILLNIKVNHLLLIMIFSSISLFYIFYNFNEYSEFQKPDLKFSESDLNPIYAKEYCHSPNDDFNLDFQILNRCLLNQSEFSKTIFLIGDSHATNHYKALKRVANPKSFNVNLLVEKGFRDDLFNIKNCVVRCGIKEGVQAYDSFFSEELNTGDYVILSFDQEKFYDISSINSQNFISKIKNLNLTIEKKGGKLILLDDIPKPCSGENKNFSLEIIKLGLVDTCIASYEFSLLKRQNLTNVYLELNKQGIVYLDPLTYLCEDNYCGLTINGKLIYSDWSPHVTEFGSEILQKFWINELIFE